MNSKSRTKRFAAYAAALLLSLSPASRLFAEGDDFGIWTSIDVKKKLTEKLSFSVEGELRTIGGVSDMDRRAITLSMGYKVSDWLKADIGYAYIQSFNDSKMSIKEYAGEDADGNELYHYNIDHSYWETRDRMYAQLTADWKIGRVKFSLRERLQYQYVHSALISEDKYRYTFDMEDPSNPYPILPEDAPYREAELKDGKHNTMIRSRLTAEWDIKKCKFEPFASVELFTRTDEWCGHDKLRYRIGTDYKIDKDNKVSLYYMYQDNHTSSSPAGHAIGVGYSFDL